MGLFILTVAVLVAAYFAFAILFPKAIPEDIDERTRKSLEQIYSASGQSDLDSTEQEVSHSFEEESAFLKAFFGLPFIKNLYPLLIKAGLRDQLSMVVLAYVGITLLSLLLLAQLGEPLLGLLLAILLPYFLIKKFAIRKIRSRNNAFLRLFPEVLDMFVRSVKSGFPVSAAFRVVAENMEPPVSIEFQRVVNELAMGQSVQASLSRLAERIDESDIHFFVVLMKVQQETGGNLAEVVSNLSNIIRKRKQLRQKIKAMTSEGRMTAYILGSLPVFVFVLLCVVSGDYMKILWTETAGMMALGTASALILSCMFIVSKMVEVDI